MVECPANYFGKGENYMLPDNPEVIREFERRFQIWEREHPDDPTGDLALAKWKQDNSGKSPVSQPIKPKGAVNLPHITTEEENPITAMPEVPVMPVISDDAVWVELELTIPREYVDQLKRYAAFMRRRPRDIIMLWITKHTKI